LSTPSKQTGEICKLASFKIRYNQFTNKNPNNFERQPNRSLTPVFSPIGELADASASQ
jgi:hypothetical protein